MTHWLQTGNIWTNLQTGQQMTDIPPEIAELRGNAAASLQPLRDALHKMDLLRISCTITTLRRFLHQQITWEDVSECGATEREQMHLVAENGCCTSHWMYRRYEDYLEWVEGGDFARNEEELTQLFEEKQILESSPHQTSDVDEGRTLLLTTTSVDHACAAAAGLVAFPGGEVQTSSSDLIAKALRDILSVPSIPGRIIVCGLLPSCPPEHLRSPLSNLKRLEVDVQWVFSASQWDRLNEQAKDELGETHHEGQSITGTMVHSFLENQGRGDALIALAEAEDEEDWVSLIRASISQEPKFGDQQHLLSVIRKLAHDRMDEQDRNLIQCFRRDSDSYVLHGTSDAIAELRKNILTFSQTSRPVLILGERGTGKEHVARLLHERSPRNGNPLTVVNCSEFAGNPDMAQARLFGHTKGAFTGAMQERVGLFKSNDGGTIFLDEVAEIPLEVQAKLLRLIEYGEVVPVGADQAPEKVDVRILAATNANLHTMMKEKTFRADLYDRLSTFILRLPPLRDRVDDVLVLAEYILDPLRNGEEIHGLDEADRKALLSYHWPGNVRELVKVLERVSLAGMSVTNAIQHDRPPRPHRDCLQPHSPDEVISLNEAMAEYACRAHRACGEGSVEETAKGNLSISPTTLRKYLKANDDHEHHDA